MAEQNPPEEIQASLEQQREEEDYLDYAKWFLKEYFNMPYEDLHLRAKMNLRNHVTSAIKQKKKEIADMWEKNIKGTTLTNIPEEAVWKWIAEEYGLSLYDFPCHWHVIDEAAYEAAEKRGDPFAMDYARNVSFEIKTEADIAAAKNKKPENRVPRWYLTKEDRDRALEFVRKVISKSQTPEL